MKTNNNKRITSIIGTLTGALSIIFSFVVKGMYVGLYEDSIEYGGDAYTGIQNAAAQAANNAMYMGKVMQFGFFAVLLIFGLALICHYGPDLLAELQAKKEATTADNNPNLNIELDTKPQEPIEAYDTVNEQ